MLGPIPKHELVVFSQSRKRWPLTTKRLIGLYQETIKQRVVGKPCRIPPPHEFADLDWFRLIVQKWLLTWCQDLDKAMKTDAFCDYTNIHEFDPPPEHLGGAGKAKYLFKAEDES